MDETLRIIVPLLFFVWPVRNPFFVSRNRPLRGSDMSNFFKPFACSNHSTHSARSASLWSIIAIRSLESHKLSFTRACVCVQSTSLVDWYDHVTIITFIKISLRWRKQIEPKTHVTQTNDRARCRYCCSGIVYRRIAMYQHPIRSRKSETIVDQWHHIHSHIN